MVSLKEVKKSRASVLLPNIFMHVVWIGIVIYIIVNLQSLRDSGQISLYVTFAGAIFAVATFGSFRLREWMKNGVI
ncbi:MULTISPECIES: hypothetical protein [Bacillus]|uniref:hypothetical protein n=1 Tax=Bacillus TaxID=1386 RepID=UPI00114446B0|nr:MULTISPECIES: hypothetical protein [Bacillus]